MLPLSAASAAELPAFSRLKSKPLRPPRMLMWIWLTPDPGGQNCWYRGKNSLFHPHFVSSETTVNYNYRFELTVCFARCWSVLRFESASYSCAAALPFINSFVL